MSRKISDQQYQNALDFIGCGYKSSLDPPYDIEVLVLTAGFNVGRAYYIGLNEYQATSFLPDDEEIIAWKHI